MTDINRGNNCKLLDGVRAACQEIQQALNEHFESTTSVQYKMDIDKDLVVLKNLKHIITAVKEDIEIDKIGASTELLLRIAVNDFKKKLEQIPEKKTLRRDIIKALKEVHRDILKVNI
jgi:hydrogenase maturation factor HypE